MGPVIDDNKIQDLLQSDQGLSALLGPVLNQVLDAEMAEHLQAAPHEQTDRRQGYLLIFAGLLAIYRRRGPALPHGLLSGLFLTSVFSVRIALEPFKIPQAAFAGRLPLFSMGQWLSLPFVAVGLALVARAVLPDRYLPSDREADR